MAMVRWEPFREATNLQTAFERLFQDGGASSPRLALNAYETDDALVFEAAVPGSKRESFEISYKDQFLTLKCNLGQEKQVENARYHLRERVYGETSRTLRLPFPVDADKASASFADGVLTLTLPKSEAVKPRSIPIN